MLGIPCVLPVPQDVVCARLNPTANQQPEDTTDEHGQQVDRQPHKLCDEPLHPLYCKKPGRSGLQIVRHDQIAKAVSYALGKIFGSSKIKLEPRINDTTQRRGDLLITTMYGATKTILDVLVTCPAAPSNISKHNTKRAPGAAAEAGVRTKQRKYARDIPTGTRFVPFVIETGGRLAKATVDWLDNY